jgi:hypothetical protein
MIQLFVFLFACNSAPPAPEAMSPVAPASVPTAPSPTAAAHAAGDHAHGAPHGGIVQTVGEYHVEALILPTGVMFYLSDAEEKPLSVQGFGGSVVVNGPAGVATVALAPMGDHLHAVAALEQGKPASLVLTLTREGKALSASFATDSVGLASHDHTSLHGGQVSMWGDHHVEYAAKYGEYRVWVTDEHRNPAPGPVSGSIKEGEVVTPLVYNAAENVLSAKAEGAGTKSAMVDLKVGETGFSLSFAAAPVATPEPAHGHDHGDHGHAH